MLGLELQFEWAWLAAQIGRGAMNRAIALSAMLAMCAAFSAASAAPVTYTFTTSAVSSGDFGTGATFLSGALSGLSVSGTFMYDPHAAPTGTLADGSTIYAGANSPNSRALRVHRRI